MIDFKVGVNVEEPVTKKVITALTIENLKRISTKIVKRESLLSLKDINIINNGEAMTWGHEWKEL